MNENNGYPYWKTLVWRFLRSALAAGATSALVLQPDWSNPTEAAKILIVGFLSGFITTLFKMVRDWASEGDKGALVQKFPL